MSNLRKTKFGKIVAGLIGFATAVFLVGGVGFHTASAQSAAELQVQIQSLLQTISSLQAQLAALEGGGSGAGAGVCPYTFTQNFGVGDTGAEVMKVQQFLNTMPDTVLAASGAGSPGNETTYFGPITADAVSRFQEKYASEVLTPLGLSGGTGFWGPSSRAKANDLCTTVVQQPGDTGDTGDTGTGDGTVPQGNGLSIELAPNTPQFLITPSNISSQSFGTFLFTAGTQTAEVTGVTIRRTQLGDKDDFDDVWIVANGKQHGTDRTIITGDTATFTFSNNPIIVPAGQTVQVEIMGSYSSSATAGHYNALGFSEVNANVPVVTDLPIDGPVATISTQTAATVTLTTQGSDQTVAVGATQTELGRFKIDVDSSNDQDVHLKSILFENEGTSDELSTVIANPVLKVQGNVISTEVNLNGDFMQFVLNDYLMEDGATQSFQIVADIISAEVNDTIQLQIDEDSDVVVTEVGSSAGARVAGNDGTATNPLNNLDLKTYTVETGDVNFAIRNAASRNVAPGLDDIVMVDGDLTVDSAIEADGVKVRLQSGTDTDNDTIADLDADFENVSLKIDGLTIDTVDTLTNADGTGTAFVTGTSGDYYNFDSTFTVESGLHNIVVEADVKSDATTSDKLKLVIFSSDMDSPEYIVTGDQVPTGELTGQINGSLVTIQNAVVTVNRNDGFSSETIIGGVSDLVFMEFTITANDSSDVEVTSVTFSKGTGSFPTGFVTNMRLFVDGEQKGSAVDLTSGTITDANFMVPQSQQVQAQLVLDTNTATSTGQTLRIDLDDVSAFDAEGNTATVNHSNGSALSSSNALTSDTFTINTGGTFTLTVDGNTPDEAILVGDDGAVWYPVATYRLTAEDEDIKLTDIFLMNATSSADVLASSSFADARVKTLGLFDENGVLKSEKTLSSGAVRFDLGESENPSGFGAVIVPRDDFTKITIRAKVNSIVDADETGRLLRLVVDPSKSVTDNDGTGVIVQSTATGSDISSSSVTAARTGSTDTIRATSTAADFFVIRRSKPTITRDPLPSSILTNGSNKVIYRFTVSADANEDVAWKGVKFDLQGKFGGSNLASTTGASTFAEQADGATTVGFGTSTANCPAGCTKHVTAFELFEVATNQEVQNGDYVVQLDWDGTDDNGEVAIIMNDGTEEVVSAGTSKSYELRATLSGAGSTADSDFLSVSIDDEADDNRSNDAYLVANSDPDEVDGTADSDVDMTPNSPATNPYAFLWSDNSGSPHSLDDNNATADERDWTNDRFIEIETAASNLNEST